MSLQLLLLAMSVLSSMLLCGCGGTLWADNDVDGIESSRALRKQKKRFPLKITKAIGTLEEYLVGSVDAGTRLCIDASPVSTIEYQPSFQAQKPKGNDKDPEDSREYELARQEVANWLQPGTSMCFNPNPVVSVIVVSNVNHFIVGKIADSGMKFHFDIKAVSDIFDNSGKHQVHGDFVGKDEKVIGFVWNTVIMKHVLTGKQVIGNLGVDRTSSGADNADTFGNFGCFREHSRHTRCQDGVDLAVGDLKENDVLQIVAVCSKDRTDGSTNDDGDIEVWDSTLDQCEEIRRP